MTFFFIDLIWIKDLKRNAGTMFLSNEKIFWKNLKNKRFIQLSNKNIKQIVLKKFFLLKLFFKLKHFFIFELYGFTRLNYFLFDFFFKKNFGKSIFLEKSHCKLVYQFNHYFIESFFGKQNYEKSYLSKSLLFRINNNCNKGKFKKNKNNCYCYFDNDKEKIEKFSKNFLLIIWQFYKKELYSIEKNLFRGFLDLSCKRTTKIDNFIFTYSKTQIFLNTFDFELLNLRIFFTNINKLAITSVFLNRKKAIVIYLRSKFILANKFFRILEIIEKSRECLNIDPKLIKSVFVQKKIFFFVSIFSYLAFLAKIHNFFRSPILFKNLFVI